MTIARGQSQMSAAGLTPNGIAAPPRAAWHAERLGFDGLAPLGGFIYEMDSSW